MDNASFSPLEPDHPDYPAHWSNRIPLGIQVEIGKRIREQLFLLPVNLFLEWHEPRFPREGWFLKAAHHIEIPYFYDYWGDGND